MEACEIFELLTLKGVIGQGPSSTSLVCVAKVDVSVSSLDVDSMKAECSDKSSSKTTISGTNSGFGFGN